MSCANKQMPFPDIAQRELINAGRSESASKAHFTTTEIQHEGFECDKFHAVCNSSNSVCVGSAGLQADELRQDRAVPGVPTQHGTAPIWGEQGEGAECLRPKCLQSKPC